MQKVDRDTVYIKTVGISSMLLIKVNTVNVQDIILKIFITNGDMFHKLNAKISQIFNSLGDVYEISCDSGVV